MQIYDFFCYLANILPTIFKIFFRVPTQDMISRRVLIKLSCKRLNLKNVKNVV